MSHFLFASECAAKCLKGVVDEIPTEAKIAQLGERMTEDHKVRCSIHLLGAFLCPLFSCSYRNLLLFIVTSYCLQQTNAITKNELCNR